MISFVAKPPTNYSKISFPAVFTQTTENCLSGNYVILFLKEMPLVAGFDWLRYAFDFNPAPIRQAAVVSYTAGGAVDEYMSGFLGLRFHMPGQGEVSEQ